MASPLIFLLAFITAIIIVVPVIFETRRNHKQFEASIYEELEKRKLLTDSWGDFYDYYLKLNFEKDLITTVVESIKNYSPIAQIMMLPHDDLYKDLKIDAVNEDDDKIMWLIEKDVEGFNYEEGELIDYDINTVFQLFIFIKEKQHRI